LKGLRGDWKCWPIGRAIPARLVTQTPRARAKALCGVDLAEIDPVAILREIAGDTSAPAGARVAAAKALLEVQDQDPAENAGGDTRINARAVALMRRAN
jgi:hypothetical protein